MSKQIDYKIFLLYLQYRIAAKKSIATHENVGCFHNHNIE